MNFEDFVENLPIFKSKTITEDTKRELFNAINRSNQKRFLDLILESSSKIDTNLFEKCRKLKAKEICQERWKVMYNIYKYNKLKADKKTMVNKKTKCKLCGNNVPIYTLEGHSNRCRKIDTVYQDLKSVNENLLEICKRAVDLKRKLN